MSRIWQVRQYDDSQRFGVGYKGDDDYDAYEAGYRDGYGDAMEEVSGMNYRSGISERQGSNGGNMGYRRRRDSRGRYM